MGQVKPETISLAGAWNVQLERAEQMPEKVQGTLALPGTVARQGFGCAATGSMFYAEKRQFTGVAAFTRNVVLPRLSGRRVLLYLERTRMTRVIINGEDAGKNDRLTTAQTYDLTEFAKEGDNELCIAVDNTYAEMPHDAILASGMAAAQTNWNGILGKIEIRLEPAISVHRVRVLPDAAGKKARLFIEIAQYGDGGEAVPFGIELRELGNWGGRPVTKNDTAPAGMSEIALEYRFGEHAPLWSAQAPAMVALNILLTTAQTTYQTPVCFGLRDFAVDADKRHFAVNGQKIFLRGATDCACFPKTAAAPMDVAFWERRLQACLDHGINFVRFCAWCPPEAAFAVADKLGIYLQVELCQSGEHAFEQEQDWTYYRNEAAAILCEYANHPSFVMLTWGDRLQTNHRERLGDLCTEMRKADPTRLYAEGTNVFDGRQGVDFDSDFAAAQGNYGELWCGGTSEHTGFVYDEPPTGTMQYTQALQGLDRPALACGMEAFPAYPPFEEIKQYPEESQPALLMQCRDAMQQRSFAGMAPIFTMASGILAADCLREEVQAALRTPELAGIVLPALRARPEEPFAFAGSLNLFDASRPFDLPEHFRTFCADTVVLLAYETAVLRAGGVAEWTVKLHHFGLPLSKGEVRLRVMEDHTGREIFTKTWKMNPLMQNGVSEIAHVAVQLPDYGEAVVLEAQLCVDDQPCNSYQFFVYPAWSMNDAARSCIVTKLDDAVRLRLAAGQRLLLLPPLTAQAMPESVANTYVPECLTVTGESPAGVMGLVPNPGHPLFANFPTAGCTDARWWNLLNGSRSVRLTDLRDENGNEILPLVRMIDNPCRNEALAVAYEVRVENGVLLVCTLNILEHLGHAETAWLLRAMVEYLRSNRIHPEARLSYSVLQKQFRGKRADLARFAAPQVPVDVQHALLPLQSGENGTEHAFWDAAGMPEGQAPWYELNLAVQRPIDTIQIGFLCDAQHGLPDAIVLQSYAQDDTWQQVELKNTVHPAAGDGNLLLFAPTREERLRLVFMPANDATEETALPVAVTCIRIFAQDDPEQEE